MKTAEEILREELAIKAAELREEPINQEDWDGWKEEQGPEFMEVMWKSYRKFAVHEVEAYKERLKAEFELKAKSEYEGEEREWFLSGVKELIDTTK